MRMSLDKYTASARLSRYESGAMSISLESLFELARALEVPPAYLLASTASMADAVLALGDQPPRQQDQLAKALVALANLDTHARDELVRTLFASNAKE